MKAKHESKLIPHPTIEALDPQPGELFWTRGGEEDWSKPLVAMVVSRSITEVSYIVFRYYKESNLGWSPVGLSGSFRAECPSVKKRAKPHSRDLMQRLSDEDAAKFRRGEKIEVTPRFFA